MDDSIERFVESLSGPSPKAKTMETSWPSLTRGSGFIEKLKASIHGQAGGITSAQLEYCKTYFLMRRDVERLPEAWMFYEQAQVAYAMARFAEKAQEIVARFPHGTGDPEQTLRSRLQALDFERVSTALLGDCSGIPNLNGTTLQEWIWGSIQCLLGAKPLAAVDLPIVYVTNSPAKGEIGTLHLELFESGVPGLIHDLRDVFQLLPSERGELGFHASLRDALLAAAGSATSPKKFLGSYRVLKGWATDRARRASLPSLTTCGGASASGAARRGWELMLLNQRPDDGILVLAEFDNTGLFKPVGHLSEKIEAVLSFNRQVGIENYPPFDTVVVHKESLGEVNRLEKKLNPDGKTPTFSMPEGLDHDLVALRIEPWLKPSNP